MPRTNKTLTAIIGSLISFLLSTGASYAPTSYLYTPGENGGNSLQPGNNPTTQGSVVIDPAAPKTEECPLNGALYTKTERQIWEKRRPAFVMIENHVDARPQSGLNSADVLYEAVAEGGITRFGALFYCGTAAHDTIVAPVRSARTHFIAWASEYNRPLYVHVGGANCYGQDLRTCPVDKRVRALEQLESYDWKLANDIDAISQGFPTFWRDYERLGRTVATEHTMLSSTEKIVATGLKRNWSNLSPDKKSWEDTFTPWKFQDGAKEPDRGSVNTISFSFWESQPDMDVAWHYDQGTNLYRRETGGVAHLDLNSNEQITVNNVVVMLIKENGPVDDLKHLYYETESTGKALIFQNGQVIEATWKKASREGRTTFTNSKTGKPISFVRGKIIIEAVPSGNDITY